MGTKEKISEKILSESDSLHECEIILYNDDVNTFDHVIDTLMRVCDHTLEQAKQCSIIVHYKGKCTVKSGEFKDLEPRCSKLLQLGLSAELV